MNALGYDFCTLEFAVRDGIPYAIDFLNPAPDAAVDSVGEDNFRWVVEHAAKWLIERVEQRRRAPRRLPLARRSWPAGDAGQAPRPRPRRPAGSPRAPRVLGVRPRREA